MKRYLKPLIVAFSLFMALFLTIYRHGPDGDLGVGTSPTLNAAPDRKTNKNYDLTALKAFNVALVRIKDNYVDPKRIQPRQMLIAALEGVEKSVAEVLVQEDKKKNQLNVKVDNYEKSFDISDIDSPWALSSRIKAIFRFIQAHVHKDTDLRDIEYAAINGMLSTLDPHSMLLKPDSYNEMKLSTRGEFGGLGIVISSPKGVLTVMNPMKNTPADVAGIKACDQILKIGEESTVNMNLTDAVSRLRGAPGSSIDITLLRKGWDRPVRKTLTRAIIKVPSVTSRMLNKKIGYIKLSSFQSNSYDDLREQLDKLKEKGMKGLILDLRGNPGGLLDQAIKISDAFVGSGTLLTTVSFAGKQREEKRATPSGTEPHYPMAVLVNSGSASASEIVAGALKNLDRAIVIGHQTFGKGSVQVLYDNDDGSALKLTIAQYLTPGDLSIQGVGITPDIMTIPALVKKDYIRLSKEDHSRREQDLEKHLTYSNIRQDSKTQATLLYLAEKSSPEDEEADDKLSLTKTKNINGNKAKEENLCLIPDQECKPAEQEQFTEDFPIQVARDLLSKNNNYRRSQLLATSASFFNQTELEEEQRIANALKKLGVDWSRIPATSKKPKIKVAVATEPSNGKAKACRTTQIKVTVRNEGDAPTSQLKAVSSSTNKIFDGLEFVFGRVDPKSSRTWIVPVDIRDAPTRVDDVVLKFQEGNGSAPPPFTFPISMVGVERPVFAYGYQLIDDIKGNQDGRVQRGEEVRLFVKVRNTGKGTSFRTITTISNLSGPGIFIRKGLFVLGNLPPGETKSASFTFDIQPAFAQSNFKLELTVYDDALREYVTEKLEFPVVTTGTSLQTASGTVRINTKFGTFHTWPGKDAPDVGYAPKGAAFTVLGRTNGWYRVLVAQPARHAFISAQEVTPGGTPTPQKFVPRWQVTPPKLAVKVPSYSTTNNTIHVEGQAIDETRVSDLYIFVRNFDAKIEGRKVFYRSNGSSKTPKELRFATDIPLWPGANYVSIHARENEEVQAQETVVVFRKADSLESRTAKKAASR